MKHMFQQKLDKLLHSVAKPSNFEILGFFIQQTEMKSVHRLKY